MYLFIHYILQDIIYLSRSLLLLFPFVSTVGTIITERICQIYIFKVNKLIRESIIQLQMY